MRGLVVIAACALASLGCGVRAPPRPPRPEPPPAADAGASLDDGGTPGSESDEAPAADGFE